MSLAATPVPALAYYTFVGNNHATNHWIRACITQPVTGKLYGPAHIKFVGIH
jgi:hypothetical protein